MDTKINANQKPTGYVKKAEIPNNKSVDESREGARPLNFVYGDTDVVENEIAEFYSYTEKSEFLLNLRCFQQEIPVAPKDFNWLTLTPVERKSLMMKMLEQLEVTDDNLRMSAARCLLYIAQGCWAKVYSREQQLVMSSSNSMMLYRMDVFRAFVQLLNYEIDNSVCDERKSLEIIHSMGNSKNFRVILSVLYTIVEVIRKEQTSAVSMYRSEVDDFVSEMSSDSTDGDSLIMKLFNMILNASRFSFPQFPLKKVLLLLWKMLLVTLGDNKILASKKVTKRLRAGLQTQYENSIEVAKTLKVVDINSLDNGDTTINLNKSEESAEQDTTNDKRDPTLIINDKDLSEWNVIECVNNDKISFHTKTIPWKAKAYKNEVDKIVHNIHKKFFYYNLNDDNKIFDELPLPVEEIIKTLNKYLYISLADLQIKDENDLSKRRPSTNEEEIETTLAEVIYQAMLPKLNDYSQALLEILLCVTSAVHEKYLIINIITEIVPESIEVRNSVFNTKEFAVDINRHFEIVAKAVSSILLLLLKHFKLNHVYQFEHLAQQLVYARALPMFLKFLSQDVPEHINTTNTIPGLEFPQCVITKYLYRGTTTSLPSYRNLFTLINITRMLVKLVKRKPGRIKQLIIFNTANLIKNALDVRHATLQLYLLKLLKIQVKYLGKQWLRSNIKLVNAIYSSVRHNLITDWVYEDTLNQTDSNITLTEYLLEVAIDRYNNRRNYRCKMNNVNDERVDNYIGSVLSRDCELSTNFKKNYKLWLEDEVFKMPINWDEFISNLS